MLSDLPLYMVYALVSSYMLVTVHFICQNLNRHLIEVWPLSEY